MRGGWLKVCRAFCAMRTRDGERRGGHARRRGGRTGGDAGKDYKPGDEYATDANLELWAQYGETCQVMPPNLPLPTRDGYTFLGWFSERDGGEKVADGNSALPEDFAGETLYAHWQEDAKPAATQPEQKKTETAKQTEAPKQQARAQQQQQQPQLVQTGDAVVATAATSISVALASACAIARSRRSRQG